MSHRRRRRRFRRPAQPSPQYDAFLRSLPSSPARGRRRDRKATSLTGRITNYLSESWEEGRETREGFADGLTMAMVVLIALFSVFGLVQIASDHSEKKS